MTNVRCQTAGAEPVPAAHQGSFSALRCTVAQDVRLLLGKLQVIRRRVHYWHLLIAGGGFLLLLEFYVRGWLTSFAWLSQPITLPLWVLMAAALLFFAGPKIMRRMQERLETERVRFTLGQYTSDKIFGVEWNWAYKNLNISDPQAFCPQSGCKCRLDVKPDYSRTCGFVGPIPVTLACPHCGASFQMEWDWDEVMRRVSIEIERRIKTGEFERILAANA